MMLTETEVRQIIQEMAAIADVTVDNCATSILRKEGEIIGSRMTLVLVSELGNRTYKTSGWHVMSRERFSEIIRNTMVNWI